MRKETQKQTITTTYKHIGICLLIVVLLTQMVLYPLCVSVWTMLILSCIAGYMLGSKEIVSISY